MKSISTSDANYSVTTTMEFKTSKGIVMEDLLAFMTPFPANTVINFESDHYGDYTTILVILPLVRDGA